LSREVGQDGICHALRHHNGTNGDTYIGSISLGSLGYNTPQSWLTSGKITVQPLQVIPPNPVDKGKQLARIGHYLRAGWSNTAKPLKYGRFILDEERVRRGEDGLATGYCVQRRVAGLGSLDPQDGLCQFLGTGADRHTRTLDPDKTR
jgi:hypothetical protein